MEKHELTFKDGNTGEEIHIAFDKDGNVNKWKDVIKSIMVFATFNSSVLEFLDVDE